MAVQFVLRSTFLLLLTCGLAAPPPPPPNAKPGCKADCGNVTSIPYPFGIGPGCYMDDWFEIDCNATGAFLKRISMEVLQIDISSDESGRESTVLVKSPIIYSNYCRNRTGGTVNLTGSPFVFSSSFNMFTAVGCDNFATMTATEPMVVGCKSECNVSNSYRSEELKCSGVDCCQSTIPSRLEVFSAEFRSKDYQSPGSECKYAFLAYQKWFESNITVPTSVGNREYVPMVLDWEIYNSTQNSIQMYESLQRRSESNSVDCYETVTTSGGNTEFSSSRFRASSSRNFSSFFCECATGYEGNPYLSCEDINECEDSRCPNNIECENTEGGYSCKKRNFPLKKVIIGVGIGLIVVLICSSCLYLIIKQRKLIKLKQRFFEQNGGLILQQKLIKEGNSVETTKIFTMEELKKATNNYDETLIIGQGGFGMVYKGFLSDNRIVAIKKSKIAEESQIEQFINEVVVVSQINHRNVVKILGCCLETPVPLLVYEFIPNGTLFEYIHHESIASTISWETRLRIAAEIAEALSYLHSAASPPIIHRDVKSSNILLDSDYTAKVSDFGASKLVPLDHTQIATLVQGTLGYLDPEYMQTSQLTEKSDVYSFGVVLIELLTGEKALSFDRPERERSLASYFLSFFKDNRLFEVLEKHIASEGNVEQLKEVANLASRCLRLEGEDRPTMREVTSKLEGLRNIKKNLWVDGDSNSEETEVTC